MKEELKNDMYLFCEALPIGSYEYYNPAFGCDSFMRIIGYMPYIVKLEFDGAQHAGMTEELIIKKKYKWCTLNSRN